jgi:hypothetical protein
MMPVPNFIFNVITAGIFYLFENKINFISSRRKNDAATIKTTKILNNRPLACSSFISVNQ